MKITAFKNKQLLILSISLGLIFFGFNAAEQHFTAFYQTIGIQNLAFQSLAILYAAIIIGNFAGPWFVDKIGIKPAFFIGYLTYAALVFGIVFKVPTLVYILSFILGIGAGIAGIARADFLRLVAPVKNRGEFAGAMETVRTFGGFAGILATSFILKILNIDQTFIILGILMTTGILLLLLLKNIKKPNKEYSETKNLKLMYKFLFDLKILLLLPYSISGGFLLGLVLGAVPLSIEKNFGIFWVGVITSIFHLTLALVLLAAGYLSDIKGRFGLIYSSMIVSILAALLFLNFLNLPSLVLVMVLLGLGGSLAGGAFTALMLDIFEEKIKEASAVLGNLSIILGVVPAFLLPQFLTQTQLFMVAIFLTILGLISMIIFQIKYSPTR